MKAKINLSNIFAYLLGNYRYWIYYRPLLRKVLMRRHIEEQIIWRLSIMDKDCFAEGSCKMCGCETPALQMANKKCDKPCYPEMHNAKVWNHLKPIYERMLINNPELFYKIIKD